MRTERPFVVFVFLSALLLILGVATAFVPTTTSSFRAYSSSGSRLFRQEKESPSPSSGTGESADGHQDGPFAAQADQPSSSSSSSVPEHPIQRTQQPSPPDQDTLERTIDSFLSGNYDLPFAENAPAPLPRLSPRDTVEQALRSLRNMNDPHPAHGAAVFLRFCVPLTQAERWALDKSLSVTNSRRRTKQGQSVKSRSSSAATEPGSSDSPNTANGANIDPDDDSANDDTWRREILRTALTPAMLGRNIRSSADFSDMLRWTKLDVTDGATPTFRRGLPPANNIAFVNVAFWFEEGTEPTIMQFTLRRVDRVWLIDTVRKTKKGLFMD